MKLFRKLRLRKSRKVGGRNFSKNFTGLRTRTPFTSGEEPPTPQEAAAASAAASAAAAAAAAAAAQQVVVNYKASLARGIALVEHMFSHRFEPAFSDDIRPIAIKSWEKAAQIRTILEREQADVNRFEQQNPGSILDLSEHQAPLTANLLKIQELATELNIPLPREEIPHNGDPLDGGRYRKRKKRRTLRRKSRYLRR